MISSVPGWSNNNCREPCAPLKPYFGMSGQLSKLANKEEK
jgi:hypothetical protein